MATPIHVLCSNFTEIVRREAGETAICWQKNFAKCVFGTILRPFGGGAKSLHVTLRLHVKLRLNRNRFRFAGVIPEKWFGTITVCLHTFLHNSWSIGLSSPQRPNVQPWQLHSLHSFTCLHECQIILFGDGGIRVWTVCYRSKLSMVFTVRLHVMQRTVLLSQFCLSVRPSHALMFDTTRKGNHSATPTPTVVVGRCPLPSEICAQTDPPPFEKRRPRHISAYRLTSQP